MNLQFLPGTCSSVAFQWGHSLLQASICFGVLLGLQVDLFFTVDLQEFPEHSCLTMVCIPGFRRISALMLEAVPLLQLSWGLHNCSGTLFFTPRVVLSCAETFYPS